MYLPGAGVGGPDDIGRTSIRSPVSRRRHSADTDRVAADGSGSAEHDRATHAETVRSDAEPPRAVLYVRGSRACCDRETAVLDDLRGLAERGAVGDVTVRTWPARITLGDAGATRAEFVAECGRLGRLARGRAVSLRPPFVVRHLDSTITRESEDVLVTPALLLTIWAGDELVSVYPHHDDGLVVTVADAIDGLARVEGARVVPVASIRSKGDPERR
mgnify:CR=1 FL=1